MCASEVIGMASNRTKKARILAIIFSVLHILCMLGPFLYFLPMAFINAAVVEKLSLGLTTILCLVLAAISMIVDVSHRANLHRTILWVLILGIMICLSEVQVFIYVIAITSIIDELLIVRLAERFKTIKNTNKEIDKALSR